MPNPFGSGRIPGWLNSAPSQTSAPQPPTATLAFYNCKFNFNFGDSLPPRADDTLLRAPAPSALVSLPSTPPRAPPTVHSPTPPPRQPSPPGTTPGTPTRHRLPTTVPSTPDSGQDEPDDKPANQPPATPGGRDRHSASRQPFSLPLFLHAPDDSDYAPPELGLSGMLPPHLRAALRQEPPPPAAGGGLGAAPSSMPRGGKEEQTEGAVGKAEGVLRRDWEEELKRQEEESRNSQTGEGGRKRKRESDGDGRGKTVVVTRGPWTGSFVNGEGRREKGGGGGGASELAERVGLSQGYGLASQKGGDSSETPTGVVGYWDVWRKHVTAKNGKEEEEEEGEDVGDSAKACKGCDGCASDGEEAEGDGKGEGQVKVEAERSDAGGFLFGGPRKEGTPAARNGHANVGSRARLFTIKPAPFPSHSVGPSTLTVPSRSSFTAPAQSIFAAPPPSSFTGPPRSPPTDPSL